MIPAVKIDIPALNIKLFDMVNPHLIFKGFSPALRHLHRCICSTKLNSRADKLKRPDVITGALGPDSAVIVIKRGIR